MKSSFYAELCLIPRLFVTTIILNACKSYMYAVVKIFHLYNFGQHQSDWEETRQSCRETHYRLQVLQI